MATAGSQTPDESADEVRDNTAELGQFGRGSLKHRGGKSNPHRKGRHHRAGGFNARQQGGYEASFVFGQVIPWEPIVRFSSGFIWKPMECTQRINLSGRSQSDLYV